MFVSRTSTTGSSRTSASGCVVGGWLLTMAAVGGFAFAAGDNLQDTATLPAATPAVSTTEQSPSTTASAVTVYLPATAGAMADGRGPHVAIATRTAPTLSDLHCDLDRRSGPGLTISRVSSSDRPSRSSSSRGPASISRIGVTACRLAGTSTGPAKPATQLKSAGAALPGH